MRCFVKGWGCGFAGGVDICHFAKIKVISKKDYSILMPCEF